VTEHEQLGMEAWLEAYHSTSSGSNNAINFGQLEARAGSIQVNHLTTDSRLFSCVKTNYFL